MQKPVVLVGVVTALFGALPSTGCFSSETSGTDLQAPAEGPYLVSEVASMSGNGCAGVDDFELHTDAEIIYDNLSDAPRNYTLVLDLRSAHGEFHPLRLDCWMDWAAYAQTEEGPPPNDDYHAYTCGLNAGSLFNLEPDLDARWEITIEATGTFGDKRAYGAYLISRDAELTLTIGETCLGEDCEASAFQTGDCLEEAIFSFQSDICAPEGNVECE